MLLRPLSRAAVALIVGLGALAPAVARAHEDPAVQTTPATRVTDTSATLTGIVGPLAGKAVYTFQYGPTDYGRSTPSAAVPDSGKQARPVSATVTGLTPGTLYHFRLVVVDDHQRPWTGDEQTFTTAATSLAPAAAPAPSPLPAAAPVPTLGTSVVVAPVAGTVLVKGPGAAGYTALQAGGSVPVGATVDTRAGTVRLTTAVAGGGTQAAELHGGVFRVRQTAAGRGMTDIDLRGPALTCTHVRAGTAAVATKRKRAARKLWARDTGGRFRTHGRNSVATVRGTSWVTTDTCAGTRTTVTEGAVAVRDLRRGRSVLVRAGHSYLARGRRASR